MLMIIRKSEANKFVLEETELKLMFLRAFDDIVDKISERKPKSIHHLFDDVDLLLTKEEKENIINNQISQQMKTMNLETEK